MNPSDPTSHNEPDHLTDNPDGKQWLENVANENSLARRCAMILEDSPSPKIAARAVRRSLAALPSGRAAALALVLLPVVLSRTGGFDHKTAAEVVRHAAPVLEVDGLAEWTLYRGEDPAGHPHPLLEECEGVLAGIKSEHAVLVRQLFLHCTVKNLPIDDPFDLGRQLSAAIRTVARHIIRTHQ